MSFQIKYQNEFLDLVPGQSAEIERNSPLFLLENIIAEYSTPVQLAYSDKNCRLIGLYFFDTTIKQQTKIDVEIYCNGTFRYNATMVIESAGMNFTHPGAGTASGYLLTGISNFFSRIKDKKLSDLILGGDRNFAHTSDDPTDGSDGYWQHFQQIYDFSDDYVMVPYRNALFTADDIEFQTTEGWGNMFDNFTGKIKVNQPVVPFTKVEYVLQQIFAEAGWKLDTTGINDEEWKRLLLYSNYTISTYLYSVTGLSIVSTPMFSVTVNLAKAMPPDVTCSSLLFELCKRYFWAPVFDVNSSTCKIIALKEIPAKPAKDWTKYASPVAASDFTSGDKIFAFKNNFTDDADIPGAPDFTGLVSAGFVPSKNLLLPPAYANQNGFTYAFLENKWYKVQYDADSNTASWVELADNIYDYEPDGATDTFETNVTTLPLERVAVASGVIGLFPSVNQGKNTKWGIRTVIYHGMVHYIDEDNTPLSNSYPYASSTNTPPAQEADGILPWSNVFSDDTLTESFGIKDYWGKKWTDAIISSEEITRNFYLPLIELIRFTWQDKIMIRNMPFIIKSMVEPLDQAGEIVKVQAKLQPVKLVAYAAEVVTPATDVHFDHVTLLNEDGFNIIQQTYVVGPAGATITIKVVEYAASTSDFYFKVNNITKVLDDTFTLTLDANGKANFNTKTGGAPTTSGGIVVKLQITLTDTGVVGSPDSEIYSKTI